MIFNETVERLIVAAVGGGLALAVTLAICQFASIHPAVKTWICRLVMAKFIVGLFLGAGIAVQSDSSELGWFTAEMALFLLLTWAAGLLVVLHHNSRAYSCARKLVLAAPVGTPNQDAPGLPVRIVAGLPEPCLVGVFRPVLAIPERCPIDVAVIRHEVAHLRHGDPFFGAVSWLVYAVFWFVPGLSRLVAEHNLWQEVWADLEARRSLSIEPGSQANALLAAASRMQEIPSAALGFRGEAGAVARRIQAMFVRRHSVVASVLGCVLAAAILVPVHPVESATRGEMTYASPISPRVVAPMAGR